MKSPVIQTLLSVLLAGGAVAWAADDSSFAGYLAKEPTAKSLRTIAEDQQYKFAGHHFGTGGEDGAASVYVFSQSARQWARIDQIATRDAVLGRAPDMDKVMLAVGWDPAGLKNQKYSAIPLRTSGSIMLPDKIEFDAERGVYRLTHGSTYGKHSHPTILTIRRDDLDAFFPAPPLAVRLEFVKPPARGRPGDPIEVAAWIVNSTRQEQVYKGGLSDMVTSRDRLRGNAPDRRREDVDGGRLAGPATPQLH